MHGTSSTCGPGRALCRRRPPASTATPTSPALLYETIDLLRERFVSGEDRRAPGMMIAVSNPILKEHQNRARWRTTGFVFIGENRGGDHVRVLWFPGAEAPPPPGSPPAGSVGYG